MRYEGWERGTVNGNKTKMVDGEEKKELVYVNPRQSLGKAPARNKSIANPTHRTKTIIQHEIGARERERENGNLRLRASSASFALS